MASQSNIDFNRISAMIVDGNTHMRVLLRTILHNLGVDDVREVADAASAMVELAHKSANILIIELNMKPMDGLQLTKLIRTSENSPCPYIPIIMMTGDTTAATIFLARDHGIDEFLAKPLSPRKLLDRILAIVNNPRVFVNTESFFGPDRRRRLSDISEDRRKLEAAFEKRPEQF
jgi:two-component system chemotaxis response regulator CheY